jgi:hypothetical protein
VLEVSSAGERWHATVLNVSGFSAQGDRRIVIGLNGNPRPVRARILWGDGAEEDLGTFGTGRYHLIRKPNPPKSIVSESPAAFAPR